MLHDYYLMFKYNYQSKTWCVVLLLYAIVFAKLLLLSNMLSYYVHLMMLIFYRTILSFYTVFPIIF